ncbi:MAG: insulinase family protein [Acidobacteria bacterium]|nr:insulinase family protein [Acidobacteriota bacterium]
MLTRNTLFSILAMIPALAAQPAAAPAKQKPPAPGPAPAFSFPKYESRKLANGLTVFVVEDRRQPIVSYRLAVNAGSTMEDPKKSGLASMTATLLRNGGTKSRTSPEISKLVDQNGGSLDAAAVEDAAQVSGVWLKSHADLGFELLADIVLNPAFDTQELERMRSQTLSGLQIAFSDPESLIGFAAPRVIYGQNPYGYPGGGTPDTIRGLTRDDLVAFHKSFYVPAGAYLAITGAMPAAEAFALVEKHLGKWTGAAPAAPKAPAPPPTERRIVVINKPDAPQSRIFVGELGVPRNNPDFIPLLLADHAYGEDFTSRLNLKLRANEGLTYGASSSLQSFRTAGAFVTETFTRTEKTAEAVKMILDVQKDFAANPTTATELSDGQKPIIGKFQLGLETPEAVASRLISGAVNGLPPDYWQGYVDKLKSATLDQVNAAAKKYRQPDRTAIVIVGNASQFTKDLAGLGPIRTINVEDFDPVATDLVRPKEATPAATAETKAKAMAMVEAAVKAMGGAEALRAVKDLTSTSTVTLKSPQGEIKAESTEEILYPDKLRATMKLPFGEMQQVFDGKGFWLKQGPMVREMPPNLVPEAVRSILAAGAIGVLRDAIDGKAEVQAAANDGVLWKEGASSMTLYFDPATHLVSKMVYKSMGMGAPIEVEQTVTDYRAVGGLQLPFKEALSQGGQPGGDRTFTDRKINTGVPATSFAKPQQ